MDEVNVPVGSDQIDLIDLTADIVSAYVSNNSVTVVELSALVSRVHAAITGLRAPPAPVEPAVERSSAAQIRKSITPEALISFVDGKPYKTLKRHLNGHGMTFEQYRERFGLPRDYPATAPSYSERRSALAKSLGLGQQRRKDGPNAHETAAPVAAAPKVLGRKKPAKSAAIPAEKPDKSRSSNKVRSPKKPAAVG